jgi:LPS export ABC transporter protein LptC
MLTSYRDSVTQVTEFLEQVNVPLLILISVIFFQSGCSMSDYDRQAIQQALADSTNHTSETWGVKMELMEDGVRFVQILSPHAITTELKEETTTLLRGPVDIQIRDSSGVVQTRVSANKATYYGRRSEFFLEGDVVVTTEGKRILKTSSLTWFQFSREIKTEDFVTIITPRDSINGQGLIGDDRLVTYTIGRVTGSFTIETSSDQDNS